ncbi:zinc-binding metallopeptidase family protein [Caballeronia grimmiae]|uniref:zinc-binding metallopeptidase family protein n=1 Tax=Caballeronia grimmiae TaxID=1071679 RepID=UPI0038B9843C
MKAFYCTDCGHLIFFENDQCERCGSRLGFIPETGQMSAFVKLKGPRWEAKPAVGDVRYKPCHNYSVEKVCNWMVPEDSPDLFCHSCRLTGVIPNLKAPRRRYYWGRLEAAKRRLLYTLAVLGLRVDTRKEQPGTGLEFEFLESRRGKKVLTGHHSGLITMNIAEADDVRRERVRIAMREPYRTLLGHFRHEIGHYYFDRLVVGARRTASFRTLFGDDRASYSEALSRHYHNGAPADWATNHVSAYATMHPWEDWAETWAHYLHIVDTTGTARACGINIAPVSRKGPTFAAQVLPHSPSFELLMKQWTMLTYAMNSLNRSLGMPDPYPFTLAPGAVKKLRFIHRLIEAQSLEQEHDRVEANSP